ncbi:MAG: AAA family ATPase [Paludibacteraceae bacterium]|nr:AAA family ATPase [Paludibacteraceae bacterium]
MKTIKIKSMRFVNFKGLRDFSIEFNDDVTRVLGRNGSGKTTIFDGFTWLLFGKDSEDRQSFNIKTLDESGVAIPQIPHEVSAVISVDGTDITLRRVYAEKWVKRRGTVSAEFTGHTEERYYNDVPCSMKEYNDKIAELCSEQVFKFITNPTYFSRQKTDVQRAMLIRMAGGISDDDIAAGNDDFTTLLAQLTGKTLDEYKREVAVKRSKLKAEIETLPDRIDERKRDVPEAEDWSAIESEIKKLTSEKFEIDAEIADAAVAMRKASDARMAVIAELNNVRSQKMRREYEVKEVALAAWRKRKSERQALLASIDNDSREITRLQQQQSSNANTLHRLLNEREQLVEEYRAIKAETLEISESEFVCPTCHRRYEIDEIESKQQEITEAFNSRRAKRLEENKRKGLAVRSQIDTLNEQQQMIEDKITQLQAAIVKSKQQPLYTESFDVEPDTHDAIASDSEYIALCERETSLQEQSNSTLQEQSNSTLQEQSNVLADKIAELRVRLSKRDIIERNDKRIAELEEQLKTQNAELARLEGIEFTIAEFSKARINAVEQRINSMFKIVRFKMFAKQINGGEVETCEATVNGVPYNNGLNNAMRIIAGLDIINAICKFEGVCAPIFIDNAESVNEIPDTLSQLICLVVTDDEQLTIDNKKSAAQATLFN